MRKRTALHFIRNLLQKGGTDCDPPVNPTELRIAAIFFILVSLSSPSLFSQPLFFLTTFLDFSGNESPGHGTHSPRLLARQSTHACLLQLFPIVSRRVRALRVPDIILYVLCRFLFFSAYEVLTFHRFQPGNSILWVRSLPRTASLSTSRPDKPLDFAFELDIVSDLSLSTDPVLLSRRPSSSQSTFSPSLRYSC